MNNKKLILKAIITIISHTLAKSNIQKDYGKIETWTLKLPRISEQIPQLEPSEANPFATDVPLLKGDEFDENPSLTIPIEPDTPTIPEVIPVNPEIIPESPLTDSQCPVTQEPAPSTTTFYDLILTMTENEIYLTDEASFTLREEMRRYINAYGSCVCPTSEVYFDNVYRLETTTGGFSSRTMILRRKSRRLISNAKNRMASPGMYKPPPAVDFGKLISDSINKNHNAMRHYNRHLQESNPNCDYLSTSFAQRLNATQAFLGIIQNASVDETSITTCARHEETCCNHISFSATCNSDHYDESSLCQLKCCCNFPESKCCEDVLEQKKCDFGNFCFGYQKPETINPTEIKKVSVYFPGIGEITKQDFY